MRANRILTAGNIGQRAWKRNLSQSGVSRLCMQILDSAPRERQGVLLLVGRGILRATRELLKTLK